MGGAVASEVMGAVGAIGSAAEVAERAVAAESEQMTNAIEDFVGAARNFLGDNFTVIKPEEGSDLILRSEDGLRQIRFDVSDPHGLDPHVNIETFTPRDAYPGDTRMIQTENTHVFPKQ